MGSNLLRRILGGVFLVSSVYWSSVGVTCYIPNAPATYCFYTSYIASAVFDPSCGEFGILCTYNSEIGNPPYCADVSPYVVCPSGTPNAPASPGSYSPGPSASCTAANSTILSESQRLLEAVPIVGAPFSLVYSSGRVVGNTSWYQMNVPLTSSSPASSLTGINLTSTVGSEVTNYSYTSPVASYNYTFTWDGKDQYGNPVSGSQPYSSSATEVNSPANPGYEVPIYSGAGINPPIYVGFTYIEWVGLGGWDINIHHYYDAMRGTLYYGNGMSIVTPYQTVTGGFMVVEPDASEAYIFDTTWRHISTAPMIATRSPWW